VTHPDESPGFPTRQYIAASYVKWIESSGGRVVPIPNTTPPDQMVKLLRSINGLMLTGGGFIYPDIMDHVFNEVVKMNDEGIHFPVWGTCLGFQWVSQYFANDRHLLKSHPVADAPLHLDFVSTANQTSWFNNMDSSLKKIFASKDFKVTMNNHNWGVAVDDFHKKLSGNFTLISTNIDTVGGTFVSTMQHRKFPIYGAQWHPEKNNYEFGVNHSGDSYSSTMHSIESVLASQYCSNLFVEECRKNSNSFSNWKELQARLTYSHTKRRGNTGSFVEKYWFEQYV
jgi:gamma-glutamyl hydrolase